MADLYPLNPVGNWLKRVRCMPKSMVFLALGIVFMLLFASPALGGVKVIGGVTIEYELLENTDYCLSDCYLKFKFRIDKDYTIDNLNKFKRIFKKVRGDVNIVEHGFRIGRTEKYNKSIWIPNIVCDPYNITANETIIEIPNCTGTGYYGNQEKERFVYKDFSPVGKTIQANKWYYIELWGRRDYDFYKRDAVDAVPIFADFEFPFAIWDSYPYRYEIYSNATSVIPIYLNLTLDGSPLGVWTLNASDGEKKYLYCLVSNCADGNWSIGNTTDETAWENESTRDGNNPTTVWGNENVGVYHLFDSPADSSLYSEPSTWEDGPSYDPSGVFGTCGNFNGTNNINISDSPHNSITGNISVVAWFKGSTTAAVGIVTKDNDVPANGRSWFLTAEGDRAVFFIYKTKTVKSFIQTDTLLPDDEWIMLVGTYEYIGDGTSKINIYINGTADATEVTNAIGPIVDSTTPVNIGAAHRPGARKFFTGLIDEARIYNRTLSATEILEMYYDGIDNLTSLGDEERSSVVHSGLSFTAPTLANNSYTRNNYIEVNASSSVNATSCDLEWDDGTPSNETMAITNADGNTSCWLNMTSLSDREYLFTVYGDLIVIGINATGERNITVDATAPSIIITEPSGTITSTSVDVNYTATDAGGNLDECWYSLDNGANTTLTSCLNTTIVINIANNYTIIVYANDTLGNIGFDSSSFTLMVLNIDIYNASDNATITDWHIYMLNGSGTNYSNFTNTNTFVLNLSDVPGNVTETIIWASGYGNMTFTFTNNGNASIVTERHLISDTFFVNIGAPPNNSIQNNTVLLNITLPNYAEGNSSIWYIIAGSSSYTLGCANCTGYSANIQLDSGKQWVTALINASDHYLGVNNENKTYNFTVFTAKYNISFFDEMTNKSIDFSANKNGTLRVFCLDRTIQDQSVTGTLHEFSINCSGALDYIWFKLYDPNGNHYRTLIPSVQIGNITFYMINTTPPDVTINFVTFLVTDASLLYPAGILHFKKVILAIGQKDIIDTTIGTDGKIYANLITSETYTISVESADGTNSKTLGKYTVPDATTTNQPLTIIDITFIPTTYSFIGTDITWSMQFNTTNSRIYFYYNDSSEQTTSIKFWIYNITNVSARTQMYYDTVSGQSHHLFQWDYVTNGNENDTYLGYFEVAHTIHGNITESRPLAKGGIFYDWLGNIGKDWYHIIAIFIIVFVASIFGAKSAPIGAVILAIIAGFLFYIEWLPSIIAGAVRLTDLLMISLIALAILAMFIIKRRRT